MSDPGPAAVCVALAALAQRELALVEAGALEELDAVHEQRLVLLDALPAAGAAALGEADREQLRSAARAQMLAGEAMRQRRDALRRDLGHSGQARRAAAGYRASAQL